jgi:hypothetical protein
MGLLFTLARALGPFNHQIRRLSRRWQAENTDAQEVVR